MAGIDEMARICKILSVPTRVQIVKLLGKRSLCVGALSAKLHVTQGAVSQHLRVLRDSDVVAAERKGCRVHYSLNEKTLTKWKAVFARFPKA